MKYFTKEYYVSEWLTYANEHVKKSKNAERRDEKFYRRTYDKIYTIFAKSAKMCSWYQDPIEELRKIDNYINEPNITDEERTRRIEFKKAHEYLNRKRIQSGKVFKFDEELCRQKFIERNM